MKHLERFLEIFFVLTVCLYPIFHLSYGEVPMWGFLKAVFVGSLGGITAWITLCNLIHDIDES